MNDVFSIQGSSIFLKNDLVHAWIQVIKKRTLFTVALFFVLILIVLALFAPQLAPYDPLKTNLKHKTEGPSVQHPLGTDEIGRDVLSRIIFGTRTSLLISFLVVGLSVLIGIILGMSAAYYGGLYDECISRIIDIFLSFPGLLIALPLLAFLLPGIGSMVLVLTITNWTSFARVIRNETYSVKNQEYILSAKLSGLPGTKIMFTRLC